MGHPRFNHYPDVGHATELSALETRTHLLRNRNKTHFFSSVPPRIAIVLHFLGSVALGRVVPQQEEEIYGTG